MEMLDIVDLRLIASGHVHQRRDFTHGHVRHVWAPSTGLPIPGYRVRCSCCGRRRLARGHQARTGPENASFQRRLLLPSVFGDGGKLASITEAEAR
jgi:hypothetical protein